MLKIAHLLEGSSTEGTRSSALQPLLWVILLCLIGISSTVPFGGPGWLIKVIAGLLVAAVLVSIGSFIFLLIKDRDALRSEKFVLSKMAIEQGLVGDSESGLIDIGPETPRLRGRSEQEGGQS